MKKSDDTGGSSRAPTDIDRLVGNNVRRLRVQRQGTLSELAAELGISHQQLQKYETGSNRLSAGMVARMAELFGVPINSLFQDEEAAEGTRATRAERRLAELRDEGVWLLGRAGSEEALRQMVDVLRVLSAKK